jgi:hypothetical protein
MPTELQPVDMTLDRAHLLDLPVDWDLSVMLHTKCCSGLAEVPPWNRVPRGASAPAPDSIEPDILVKCIDHSLWPNTSPVRNTPQQRHVAPSGLCRNIPAGP